MKWGYYMWWCSRPCRKVRAAAGNFDVGALADLFGQGLNVCAVVNVFFFSETNFLFNQNRGTYGSLVLDSGLPCPYPGHGYALSGRRFTKSADW